MKVPPDRDSSDGFKNCSRSECVCWVPEGHITVHTNKENTNIRCFSRLSIPIYIFTKIKTEIRPFCTHYPLLLSKINKKLFYIFNRLLNSRSQIRITRTCRTTKINNLSFSVYQDIIWHIMHIPLVTNLLIIFFSNIKYIDNQLVNVIKIQMICKCKYKTI